MQALKRLAEQQGAHVEFATEGNETNDILFISSNQQEHLREFASTISNLQLELKLQPDAREIVRLSNLQIEKLSQQKRTAPFTLFDQFQAEVATVFTAAEKERTVKHAKQKRQKEKGVGVMQSKKGRKIKQGKQQTPNGKMRSKKSKQQPQKNKRENKKTTNELQNNRPHKLWLPPGWQLHGSI